MRRRQAIHAVDVEELEDHLRNQVDALSAAGLTDDEAFLVAVKRLGDLDSLSSEFAREYSERLWKQLVVSPSPAQEAAGSLREGTVAVFLAVGAAVAIKLPELFGLALTGAEPADEFYARNLSLFVLPFLVAYFAWKRGIGRGSLSWLVLPFLAGAVAANVMPVAPPRHTMVLAALHLPIALWLAVGPAYTGCRWGDPERRMDFVRFSGEWFIYYALIAFGGGVLMSTTNFMFRAIGLQLDTVLTTWLLPAGAAGAVLISAWLVEAKQSVVENMAPVLTRVFTPLFTLLLLAFLGTMIWTGSGIDVEREVLIGFDLLLALVLGLLLYSISARDKSSPPGLFDWLQLLLVLAALVVDVLALWAISSRISEFGFSANKVAALGENLILLVNLGWSAVLYARFIGARAPFAELERWQTSYLPVYAIWAWVVVVLFPPAFGFR